MLSTLKNEQYLHEQLNNFELTLQKHALPIDNIKSLDQIQSVKYSPNGAYCIIDKKLTTDEQLKRKNWNDFIYTLWDTKNHTDIAQFETKPQFSPCSTYLMLEAEKIVLFDLTTHKISAIEVPNKLTCYDDVTMSPDGKYIAAHSVLEQRNITVWHRKDPESIIQLPTNKHLSALKAAIAFHPNKTHMLIANWKNNDISLYNLTTPEAEPIIVASNCKNAHYPYSSISELIINKSDSYMIAKSVFGELIKLFNIADLTNVIDITDAIDIYLTRGAQFIGDTNWIAYTKFFTDDYADRLCLFNSDTRITIPYDIPCYDIVYDHNNHLLIVKPVVYRHSYEKNKNLCLINLAKCSSQDEKALANYEILPLKEQSKLINATINNNGFLVYNHEKAVVLCDTYGSELTKIEKTSGDFTPINPTDNNIILATKSDGIYKLIQWEWDYKPIDKTKIKNIPNK